MLNDFGLFYYRVLQMFSPMYLVLKTREEGENHIKDHVLTTNPHLVDILVGPSLLLMK